MKFKGYIFRASANEKIKDCKSLEQAITFIKKQRWKKEVTFCNINLISEKGAYAIFLREQQKSKVTNDAEN